MKPVKTIAVGIVLVVAIGVSLIYWRQRSPAKLNFYATESRTLPGGLVLRIVTFTRGKDERVTIQCVSGAIRDYRLNMRDVRSLGPTQLAAVLSSAQAGAAVNGGYFDVDGKPVGLMRSAGVDLAAVSGKSLLSGVVMGGDGLSANIVDVNRGAWKAAPDARQTGPFLLGPRDTAGNRTALAERTAVAISGARVGVLVASPVTLDELADVLSDHAELLGVPAMQHAINLDGGPSSGLVYRVNGQSTGGEPHGRIADAIVLRPINGTP